MIYVLRYGLVLLYTLIAGPPACLAGLLGRGEAVMWIGRRWMQAILWSCGIRVDASGLENVQSGAQIFMSNHQSVVDIAAIVVVLPVPVRFVAKRELTWIPFFGWALALGGHVIVDRSNRQQAVASLGRAAVRIRNGTNVIVFPEGTRSASGELREFKSGGFHLALQAGVPIVPITVSGTLRVTPKGSLRIESGPVHVRFGEPIPTEGLGLEDRVELKRRVRQGILAGYDPALQDRPTPDPVASENPAA